jgi:ankyrin repeat protein
MKSIDKKFIKAVKDDNVKEASELIKNGADVNAFDIRGKMPIDYAVINGKLDVLELLAENGADLNAKDASGEMPMLYAVKNKNPTILKWLAENGADVNATDGTGRTSMHKAVYLNLVAVKLLSEIGADLNAKDKGGWTPMHFAVFRGDLDVVKYLAENGADVNVVAKNGRTPIDIAVDKGFTSIVDYLNKVGSGINSKKQKNISQNKNNETIKKNTSGIETIKKSGEKRDQDKQSIAGTKGNMLTGNGNNYQDLIETDTGIVGISSAGKTVFLSLLDLYMSNHEREMNLSWNIKGNVTTIRSHQKMILSGEFPLGTISGSRERYSFTIINKTDRSVITSTITDIPGEEVMGPDIAESAYDVNKFINYLTENNLSYLLNCKSLIFIIPAKNLISETESNIVQRWNRNPREISFAYRDFFNNLMNARDAILHRQKNGKLHGVLRKTKKIPILIVVSQWDIVKALFKNSTTSEEFVMQRMREFYNSFTDKADNEKISYEIMGIGIQSHTVQVEGITTFLPSLQDGDPQYIGIRDIIDWIIKNNNSKNRK